MSIKSEVLLNSLIGTNYQSNDCYIETYDINKNCTQKELLEDFLSRKDYSKITKENKRNVAFCFDCKENINLGETPVCINHNVKYLKDLADDINIELVEKNLNDVIENYEEVLKNLEEKINNFRKRNNNQIIFAKKLIDVYKSNINNLNYQIISNTKNLLHFNGINPKKFIQFHSPINFDYNILQSFSVSNYINETLTIEKIQKNLEIKFKSKKLIDCVVLLEKKNKLIFNIEKNIYLLSTKNYKLEDQVTTDHSIILMNLMDDKETILISHAKYIEKLSIENNKLFLENFLVKNVYMDKPGIIINYENDYAWTNMYNIGFKYKEYYNILEYSYEIDDRFSGGYKAIILNIFKYKDDILFIFLFLARDHHMEYMYETIKFGSYKKNLIFEQFLDLEELDDYDYRLITDQYYKINQFKPNEIIVFGMKEIYVINIFDWVIKRKISISNRLIKNSYYLNNFCSLIFFQEIDESTRVFIKDKDYNLRFWNEVKNDTSIMKICDNSHQIIFQNFLNFESGRVFYYHNDCRDNKYGLNNHLISVKGNKIEFHSLINLKNSVEMKNE